MKGVKSRQTATDEGDKLITTVYAIMHNKFFAVVKQKQGSQHSVYSIVKLKRGGKLAKSQKLYLCDKQYNTQGQAKDAIRQWDLGYTKAEASKYEPPTLKLQEAN